MTEIRAYTKDGADGGFAKMAPPVWANPTERTGRFDPQYGVYFPANAGNSLQKARAKAAKALTGQGSLHIVVHGDSQTMGGDVTYAWPYVLRNRLATYYGSGGTGIRYPVIGWGTNWAWNNATSGTSFETPVNTGVFAHNAAGSTTVKINTNASIDITAGQAYDYVVVYYGTSSGDNPIIQRNGAAGAANNWMLPAYPGQTTSASGYTFVPNQSGYSAGSPPATYGGQLVGIITPSSPTSTDVFRIKGCYGGGSSYFSGIEFRKNDSAGGVRVTNFALSGKTLQEATGGYPNGVADDNAGNSGMAIGVDMPRGDLYLVGFSGTNDWNTPAGAGTSFSDPVTFKLRLTQMVQRIRATALQGVNANSTPANGDAVLMVFPEMDYAWYLANQANDNNPTYRSFMQSVYEVADEQGVPLIDLAWRWPDHARAEALGVKADWVHPSTPVGHADYAEAVRNALTILL